MTKLCKDQLVQGLAAVVVAALLVADSATIATAAQADNAFVQQPVAFFEETEQVHRSYLEKLFTSQIMILKDRETPEHIVEILENQKDAVLPKMMDVWQKYDFEPLAALAARGIYLAIPVIPRSYRSHYDLMAMVRNGNEVGYTYLNPTRISDVVETPQKPYYIYDVEDGQATLNKSPQDAEKILKSEKRSPLTVSEVTALSAHTDVLSRKHDVWATGSRYESTDRVPNASLDGSGRPLLYWSYVDYLDDSLGSASCGSR